LNIFARILATDACDNNAVNAPHCAASGAALNVTALATRRGGSMTSYLARYSYAGEALLSLF